MGRHPPLRPFAAGDVWAVTADEANAFDSWAIEAIGVPQPVLMENAGRAAAAVLHGLAPTGRVVGVVGAGNNGGDTLVALRTLAAWGRGVCALLVADRPEADPLLHGWPIEVVGDRALDDDGWRALLAGADAVLDGILGTGARGAPRARQAEAIERVNRDGRRVFAIDVPSGIDASTGGVPGAAIRADVTVSFGAPKVGALVHPARALVGRQVVVEIGFPPLAAHAARVRVITPAWARARFPVRDTDTHKNAVGRVLVVGGRVGMAGAAILAGRGAFRAGAGMVRICSVAENREPIQAAIPEALFVDASDQAALIDAIAASDALAVGPGLGTDDHAEKTLAAVLAASATPTVLDADALNLVARPGAVDLTAVARSRPLLITPHPGEMARLRGGEADLADDRIALARAAADRFGCVVLLKGAPSVVAEAGGIVSVDTQSSSDLAVAGMGDVLAGVCAGLMAQGLDPSGAASVGLYLSGRAARLAGRGASLTPSDVVRCLPDARTENGEARTAFGLPFVTFDADPAT
jgi:NAD(P)H-hydrate epimerase